MDFASGMNIFHQPADIPIDAETILINAFVPLFLKKNPDTITWINPKKPFDFQHSKETHEKIRMNYHFYDSKLTALNNTEVGESTILSTIFIAPCLMAKQVIRLQVTQAWNVMFAEPLTQIFKTQI